MKIFRYEDAKGKEKLGALQPDGSRLEVKDGAFGSAEVAGLADVARYLAPLQPCQVLCIGLNYRQHAEETTARIPDYPVLFFKSPAAVIGPGEPIRIPTFLPSERVDYECELAVVIGKDCKNATEDDALDYVLGYTCANDVSARDWQIKHGGGQWCRGKTFDTFCPLGPWIVTKDDIPDPNRLAIRTIVNEEILQEANTEDMLFSVPQLIAFLSGSTTLPAGTVILTGTPQGVGMSRNPRRWLEPGDTVAIEIEGIGRLENPVQSEE